jgi:diguanylate cyclase (GGDEF)-like protein
MERLDSQLPKLLILDDEPGTLDALERLLRRHFRVFKTTHAVEALSLLENHADLAVILSDQRMPEVNGIDFLKTAKMKVPNAVRALLSGQINMEDLVIAINEGLMHRLLMKPWYNSYLQVQLQECVQQHRLLAERDSLQKLSITDPITQLTNHRYFQDQLRVEVERAKRHGREFSLMMLDLDHFKQFNDKWGHPFGDRVLNGVGSLLSAVVRNIDSVSRYGGEEFVIILPDTPLSSALEVADRLRKKVSDHVWNLDPTGNPVRISMSIGVATFPHHGQTPSDLIENSDKAMYVAKSRGRNRVIAASRPE